MNKRLLFVLLFLATAIKTNAQLICSPNGSIVLFTNYDGGNLNINVDVNIPNLKIGIVSYEAVSVVLSGPFVNNVTAVHYAGYNSPNTNCGVPGIPGTIITGAPVGVTPIIAVAPASPLANAYGYPSIICGYSCDTNVNQGGCNTIDQIQAYFMGQFPGSIIRSHAVQYNCWSGTQNLSGGGTCCLNPVANNLVLTALVSQPLCNVSCTGSITVSAAGGTPPYNYQWTGGPASPTYSNLCPGVYTLTVTDGAANSVTQVYTILNPAPIVTNLTQTACDWYVFNGDSLNATGIYSDTLMSANNCDSIINLNLTINSVFVGINQVGSTLTALANGASYQWFNCSTNSTVPGAVSQSYTPAVSGNYAVIVTQNGCTDTSICKNVVVSSVAEINESTLIHVYPNPVKNELFVDVVASYIGKNCHVFDFVGKVIYTQKLTSASNRITVNELSKGIYFLQIEGVQNKWKVQK